MFVTMSIKIALKSFVDGDVTKQISNNSTESKANKKHHQVGFYCPPQAVILKPEK